MARPTHTTSYRAIPGSIISTVTLALWRWRQHWFLLLVTGMGMIAAVLLVCTAPLLTEVMQTAGLRDVLSASPDSAAITLRATVAGLSTQNVEDVYRSAGSPVQKHLNAYLNGPPRFDMLSPAFGILAPRPPDTTDQMQIEATSMREARSHVNLIEGRLPESGSEDVEVAITPATASKLHVGLHSIITLDTSFFRQPVVLNTTPRVHQQLQLHVVGLFTVLPNDPFWHGDDFLPQPAPTNIQFLALASDQALLAAFDHFAQSAGLSLTFFSQPASLYWYYHLASSQVSINRLDDLISQLTTIQAYIANHFSDPLMILQPPYIQSVELFGLPLHSAAGPGSLERFRSRLAVAQIPVAMLTVLITGLLLFFLSVMATLLVDRQVEAIALLRSRGASRVQVAGVLMTQSIGLGLLALAVGPPLAILMVSFITDRLLSAAAQDALHIVTNAPVQALLSVRWYALLAGTASIAATLFSLSRASRMHIPATDRETARSRQRPLWKHLHLDMIAVLIALIGYGISVYLTSIQGLLNAQAQTLVASPLALIAPLFLVLAVILLFLRFFPSLLLLGLKRAMRSRGAAPMLALAHMTRAPRQSARMTLLLLLATAFAIFTLVFAASQAQRAQDIATYEVGADFSGNIPPSANTFPLQRETTLYQHLPGVISATVRDVEMGTVEEGTSANAPMLPLQILAVDPGTFAQTMLWTSQDSSQPLASLLAQLVSRRQAAIKSGLVPALVDAATWNSLALHPGVSFTVQQNNSQESINFIAIAEVQHLPALSSSSFGGLLVDYTSFTTVQRQQYGIEAGVNSVWLRTSDDAAALARIRATLTTSALHLEDLQDRRALGDTLRSDPLSLNLISILTIAAAAILFLVLVANFLASWLSVRSRLTSFVVLRALGAAPPEIAAVLLWEQGIVYAAALLLGAVIGALLSATLVPALIFSSVPATSDLSNSQFYALQHIIPIQIVLPFSLGIALITLFVICIMASGMMVMLALHPSPNQQLRLDEDARVDFMVREEAAPARSSPTRRASRRPRWSFLSSVVILALWRLRQTWLLQMVTGVGLVTAVVLVCAVPLFSAVTETAGLHDALRASSNSSDLSLDILTQGLSTHVFSSV
jgi:ABC-type lipoprotein release transport system permease subunit